MITKVLFREYDEAKWHRKFRLTLKNAFDLAEKQLRDHEQSVVIEHGDCIYTVYLDEKGVAKIERLN